jgi:hypothetical protein
MAVRCVSKKQTAPFCCATITQHTGTCTTDEYHMQTTINGHADEKLIGR